MFIINLRCLTGSEIYFIMMCGVDGSDGYYSVFFFLLFGFYITNNTLRKAIRCLSEVLLYSVQLSTTLCSSNLRLVSCDCIAFWDFEFLLGSAYYLLVGFVSDEVLNVT